MSTFLVRALYPYKSEHSDDLPFEAGQEITVTEVLDEEWYSGAFKDASGQEFSGIFPINYVEKVPAATSNEPPRPKTRPSHAEKVPSDDDWGSAEEEEFTEKEVNLGTPKAAAMPVPQLAPPKEDPKPPVDTQSSPQASADPLTQLTEPKLAELEAEPSAPASPVPTSEAPQKLSPHDSNKVHVAHVEPDEESLQAPPQSTGGSSKPASASSKKDTPAARPPPNVDLTPDAHEVDGDPTESLVSNFKSRMALFNQPKEEETKKEFKQPVRRTTTFSFESAQQEESRKPVTSEPEEEEAPRVSLKDRIAMLRQRQEEEQRALEEAEERRRKQKEELAARKAALEKQQKARRGSVPSISDGTVTQAPEAAEPSALLEDTRKYHEDDPIESAEGLEEEGPDDEEEARKIALRERMARLHGGRPPMFGGFGAPGARKETHSREFESMSKEEREREEARLALESAEPQSVMGFGGANMDETLLKRLGRAKDHSTVETEEPEGDAEQTSEEAIEESHEAAAEAVETTQATNAPRVFATAPAVPGPEKAAPTTTATTQAPAVPGAPAVPSAPISTMAPSTPSAPAAPKFTGNAHSAKDEEIDNEPVFITPPTSPPRAPLTPSARPAARPAPAVPTGVPAAHAAPAVPQHPAVTAAPSAPRRAPAPPVVPAVPPSPMPVTAPPTNVAFSDLADEEDNTDSELETRTPPATHQSPRGIPAVLRVPGPPVQPGNVSTSSGDADIDTDVADHQDRNSPAPAAPPPIPPAPPAPTSEPGTPSYPAAPAPPHAPAPVSMSKTSASPSIPRVPPVPSSPVTRSSGPLPPVPPAHSNHATRTAPPPPVPASAPAPPVPGAAPRPPGPPSAAPTDMRTAPPPMPGASPPLPSPAQAVAQSPPPPPPPSHVAPMPAPVRTNTSESVQSAAPSHSAQSFSHRRSISSTANYTDLSSKWYLKPKGVPPGLTNGKVFYEVDENVTTKRGGRSVVDREIYVLHEDLSQTTISVHFDQSDPASATVEQSEQPAPRIDSQTLKQYSKKFGTEILKAAQSRPPSNTAMVKELLQSIPGALPPVGTKFGYLVYENFGGASVTQTEEIRPGDIILFDDAKFQGTKGPLQKYHRELDAAFVLSEWDGAKKKVRLVESKKDAVRLSDLKSGSVRVYRALGRNIVGWE